MIDTNEVGIAQAGVRARQPRDSQHVRFREVVCAPDDACRGVQGERDVGRHARRPRDIARPGGRRGQKVGVNATQGQKLPLRLPADRVRVVVAGKGDRHERPAVRVLAQ